MKNVHFFVACIVGLFFLLTFWLLKYCFAKTSSHSLPCRKQSADLTAVLRSVSFIVALIMIRCFLFAVSYVPKVYRLRTENPSRSSIMNLRQSPQDLSLSYIPLKDIPDDFVVGLVLSEDMNYYHHIGFSPNSIKFALKVNLKHGEIMYGGSTITQQITRTLFLSPEKTISRKLKEICIAVEMEYFLSKQRILELYFNYVEWGPHIYGIADAAEYHYHKKVSELSRDEYINMLTLLPNPLIYTVDNFKECDQFERRWKQTYSSYKKYDEFKAEKQKKK